MTDGALRSKTHAKVAFVFSAETLLFGLASRRLRAGTVITSRYSWFLRYNSVLVKSMFVRGMGVRGMDVRRL